MQGISILKHKATMLVMKLATKVLNSPRPDMFVGPDSSLLLCDFIGAKSYKSVLLVTDKGLYELGLFDATKKRLESHGIEVTVFHEVSPNPTDKQIGVGVKKALEVKADAVLAFGGGSAMDAAKVIAAGMKNGKTAAQMVGLFKVGKNPAPVFAIPTTAGTGSEVTPAAVITIPEEQRKCSVGDLKLIPKAAALDANLMLGLPPSITAATGLDVLTHAIEAYVSTLTTDEIRERCEYAVSAVFKNLPTAYKDGSNQDARTAMSLASYQAGIAIAEAAVGYVHAFAHKLGGKYGIPHGLANAVILPHVLRFSKDKIEKDLATLAGIIGKPADADAFIQAVEELNDQLGIPKHFDDLKVSDFDEIFAAAQEEAMALFPVPKYMNEQEGKEILSKMVNA